MTGRMRVRFGLLVVVAIMYWAQYPLDAAGAHPGCSSACGSSTSCDLVCEYPVGEIWAFTTCGEYDGGAENGWCEPEQQLPSCGDVCGPFAPAGRECIWDEAETNCGNYGDSVTCNDGYCALGAGENCTNCEGDCGTCPIITCPNSVCAGDENYLNCPQDCAPTYGGWCGDGTCDGDEDGNSCFEDCSRVRMPVDSGSSCPYNFTRVGDFCFWDDPVLVSCGGNSGLCGFNEKCVQKSGYPGMVCVPR